MIPATATFEGWVFPDAYKQLCARRAELNRVTVSDKLSAPELAAMWDALAADFAEAGYHGLAAGCAKRAQRLRGERW
jgi:hypothetical protein